MSDKKTKKYLLMAVVALISFSSFSKFLSSLGNRNGHQDDSSVVQETLEEQPTEEPELPSTDPPTTTEEPTELQTVEETTKAVVYDELQEIFLGLSLDMKMSDINALKEGKNVVTGSESAKKGFNISFSIAYDPDVAAGYRGATGDRIDFTFSYKDGSLMFANYVTSGCSALLYNYGTYFDFREEEPNNKYSGCYCFGVPEAKGYVIEYDNGRTTNVSSCIRCKSIEDALTLINKKH